jgi:hypothetical protein
MQKLTCIAISLAVLLTLAIAITGTSRPASSSRPTLLADGPAPFPDCLPPLIPCSGSSNATRILQLRPGFSNRQLIAVAIVEPRQRARLRQAA